jgi:hypothetical protein
MLYLSSPVALAVLFVSLAVPSEAYAYIDPGSGSFLLQVLIASLLTVSFIIKTWWRNIKATFTALYARHKQSKSDGR